MKKTLFDKVWDHHIVKHITDDTHVLYIDQHFIHEVTSPQAFHELDKKGLKVFRPDRTIATADHNIPTKDLHLPIKDPNSKNQIDRLTENCKNHGIELFGMGHKNQGIVHVIGPELGLTKPGMTIVCGDSHTSTHGAIGSIAFGIGTTQVQQVLATQCLVQEKPKTMLVKIDGNLQKGVSAKDIILHVISELGMEGATGHFVEYAGSTISQLSMEERMTISNMSIEMGARGGIIGIDDTTIDYLSSIIELDQKTIEQWKNLNSDQDATYNKTVHFDASKIQPMVTVGTSPDTGIFVNDKIGINSRITQKSMNYTGFKNDQFISEQKINNVFIGSCTNGRIEDLRAAAAIAKGHKKADWVDVWVVPGSRKVRNQAIAEGLDIIFQEAGFEFREPGCSACLAMNEDKIPSGAICVSTSNRNFEGRQGEGAITILASPLTAAASAIEGKITNPTKYLNN